MRDIETRVSSPRGAVVGKRRIRSGRGALENVAGDGSAVHPLGENPVGLTGPAIQHSSQAAAWRAIVATAAAIDNSTNRVNRRHAEN
jgi:hypothetical protein